jgi:ribose 1,5-bisphosphokinase PhnN
MASPNIWFEKATATPPSSVPSPVQPLSDFDSRYGNVLTIHVTAEKDILRDRLLQRGREGKADIEKRLARAEKEVEANNLITFDNSRNLRESCARFNSLIQHAG